MEVSWYSDSISETMVLWHYTYICISIHVYLLKNFNMTHAVNDIRTDLIIIIIIITMIINLYHHESVLTTSVLLMQL